MHVVRCYIDNRQLYCKVRWTDQYVAKGSQLERATKFRLGYQTCGPPSRDGVEDRSNAFLFKMTEKIRQKQNFSCLLCYVVHHSDVLECVRYHTLDPGVC